MSFVSSKGNILCRLIKIELYKIFAIINRAIKGLHCITNLSFTEGIFPAELLKLHKFYHCIKIMILCFSTTTDPYRSFHSFQNCWKDSCIID